MRQSVGALNLPKKSNNFKSISLNQHLNRKEPPMKFTHAWANIAKENLNLKAALFITSACVLLLGFATARLALKEPLVIERSCYSKNISLANSKPNLNEMNVFIEIALEQRFNSETVITEGYLSLEEKNNKKSEQSVLEKKSISQFLIVRKIDYLNSEVIVEADRLYSVQKVRSSFPIKLKLKLESKTRTATNPYGLILVKTQEIKKRSENVKK